VDTSCFALKTVYVCIVTSGKLPENMINCR